MPNQLPSPKPNSDEALVDGARRIAKLPDATPAELADHMDERLKRLWNRHGKTDNDVKRAFVASAYANLSGLRDRLREIAAKPTAP